MTSPHARQIQHVMTANLATMPDHEATAFRMALMTACASDLVWREGSEQAAQAFYRKADALATGVPEPKALPKPEKTATDSFNATLAGRLGIFAAGFVLALLIFAAMGGGA